MLTPIQNQIVGVKKPQFTTKLSLNSQIKYFNFKQVKILPTLNSNIHKMVLNSKSFTTESNSIKSVSRKLSTFQINFEIKFGNL